MSWNFKVLRGMRCLRCNYGRAEVGWVWENSLSCWLALSCCVPTINKLMITACYLITVHEDVVFHCCLSRAITVRGTESSWEPWRSDYKTEIDSSGISNLCNKREQCSLYDSTPARGPKLSLTT